MRAFRDIDKRVPSSPPPDRVLFRLCDIPIGLAFPENRTPILAEILDCGPSIEPVAFVDLMNDKTGLKHNRVEIIGLCEGSVYSAISRPFELNASRSVVSRSD